MALRAQKHKPENGYQQDPEPNKGLGHEEINYAKLTEEDTFKSYQAIEGTLQLRKKYDFDLYKASTVTEKQFNKQTGNVGDVVVGIKIREIAPMQKTRMTWLQARELNTHVDHSMSSKYLLLSKEPKETPQFI